MGTQGTEDDPAVVDAFRTGDADAVAELYARWSPLVYSLALRSLGDVGAAEEATSRVFTDAWAARQEFDPTRTRFSAWLVDLSDAAVAAVRAGRTSPAPAPATEAPAVRVDGEARPADLAEQLLLADEMAHLDDVPREVLRMALGDALSPAQIAERTGLRLEDVRGHIASSLIELRHRLEVPAHAH